MPLSEIEQMLAYVRFEGMTMAAGCLSQVQHRILAWLVAEEQRTRGTMSASHEDRVQALTHDKGNLSHSLANLKAKGLIQSLGRPAVRPKRST